jgi:hypothetical protein
VRVLPHLVKAKYPSFGVYNIYIKCRDSRIETAASFLVFLTCYGLRNMLICFLRFSCLRKVGACENGGFNNSGLFEARRLLRIF